jgi:hypothetical protein
VCNQCAPNGTSSALFIVEFAQSKRKQQLTTTSRPRGASLLYFSNQGSNQILEGFFCVGISIQGENIGREQKKSTGTHASYWYQHFWHGVIREKYQLPLPKRDSLNDSLAL